MLDTQVANVYRKKRELCSVLNEIYAKKKEKVNILRNKSLNYELDMTDTTFTRN
jgi:hypothetical protein